MKGGEFDMIALNLHKDTSEYLEGMDKYIEKIRQMPPEDAEKFCFLSLFNSGLLNADGKEKEEIVDWE